MPTYEYRCDSCESAYDLVESFSAATTHTCQRCGKGTAKRRLHAPRVLFKGSGWYVTDSRKGSPASDNESSSPSSSSSSNGSKDSSSSDSKPSSDGAAEAAS